MISPRSFEGTSSGGNGEYVNDDETNANDEGGGMLWCIKKCIGWVEKQVQNAKNAAPLLKWPDAVLLSKQTGRDVRERDGHFSRFVCVYGDVGVHRLVHRGVSIVVVIAVM